MFNLIWDSMLDTFQNVLTELINFAVTFLNLITIDTFNSEIVKAILIFFQIIGSSLFAVATFIALLETAVAIQKGGGGYGTTALNIIKGFAASLGFVTMPQYLMIFTADITNQFVSLFRAESTSDFTTGMVNITSNALDIIGDVLVAGTGTPPIWLNVLILVAFVYCILKVALASLKRAGILIILISVGTLHIFNIPRGYTDGFLSWCKQVFALCLTHFMQIVLLVGGFCLIDTMWIFGATLMLSATEVPRIAGHFGLDTSMKTNMTQTVYATQSAMSIVKGMGK